MKCIREFFKTEKITETYTIRPWQKVIGIVGAVVFVVNSCNKIHGNNQDQSKEGGIRTVEDTVEILRNQINMNLQENVILKKGTLMVDRTRGEIHFILENPDTGTQYIRTCKQGGKLSCASTQIKLN